MSLGKRNSIIVFKKIMRLFQNSLKIIITFSAAFLTGIFSVSVYQKPNLLIVENSNFAVQQSKESKNQNKNDGTGSSNRDNGLIQNVEILTSANSKGLKVLYKPRLIYTEKARINNIEGNVRLRVTFLADGKIGAIGEIGGLPFGLTEKAIEAAKKIKFEPQIANGKPISVSKAVAFTFTIY